MNRFLFHNPIFDIGQARSMDEARAILKKARSGFEQVHQSFVALLDDTPASKNNKFDKNVFRLISSFVYGDCPIRRIMRKDTLFRLLRPYNGELFKFLVTEGADPNVKDYRGRPLLTWIARRGNSSSKTPEEKEIFFQAAEQIIAAPGVDLNLKDKNGDNALIWAVEKEYWPLIDALIENGADVNTQNKDLCTPLVILLDTFHDEEKYEMCFKAVTKFIEANVDVTLRTKRLLTARQCAMIRAMRNPSIADCLSSMVVLLEAAATKRIASSSSARKNTIH